MDLRDKSTTDLLALYAAIMDELRDRDVLRSANNPTGDLAEWLFCKAFGWSLAPKSAKGFDATDDDGIRHQIKGRRLYHPNDSRQVSVIRDFDQFDFLAGVVLDHDYRVLRAALIPVTIVRTRSTFVQRTNSYRFFLLDDLWDETSVIDVTDRLCAVEQTACEMAEPDSRR